MISNKQEQQLIRDKQFSMVTETLQTLKEADNKQELERKITRLFRHTRDNLNRSFNLALEERLK